MLSEVKNYTNANAKGDVKVEKHQTDLRMQAYHGAAVLTEDQFEGMEGFVMKNEYDGNKHAALARMFQD